MAERPDDLHDLLRAAAHQRETSLAAASPTDGVLLRTVARVRRARRGAVAARALLVAALVVGVAGAAWWVPSPQVPQPPASPSPATSPTPTPSPAGAATVDVPGLGPLVQAGRGDVEDAAEGAVLALWRAPAAEDDVRLLLVRPDGDVLHVVRAPDGARDLRAWDGGAAVVWSFGAQEAQAFRVDLLTGAAREVGSDAGAGTTTDGRPGERSPDGTAVLVRGEDGTVVVGADGVRTLQLPGPWCQVVGWSDAAHLLGTCTDAPAAGAVPHAADGPTVHLLDATSGQSVAQRALGAGDPFPVGRSVLTEVGLVVLAAPVAATPADVTATGPVCAGSLVTFDGLDPAGPLPVDRSARLDGSHLTSAPGRVLLAGRDACTDAPGPTTLEAVDLLTGVVSTLLPAPTDGAEGDGLLSWVGRG